MRALIFGGALLLSALTFAAAACGRTESAGGEDPFASIPRVTVAELAAALKEGRAVALDVRPVEAFEEGHIPGAVSIPEEEVTRRAGELPKGKLVVAYCA